jgi:hypothetical protein
MKYFNVLKIKENFKFLSTPIPTPPPSPPVWMCGPGGCTFSGARPRTWAGAPSPQGPLALGPLRAPRPQPFRGPRPRPSRAPRPGPFEGPSPSALQGPPPLAPKGPLPSALWGPPAPGPPGAPRGPQPRALGASYAQPQKIFFLNW